MDVARAYGIALDGHGGTGDALATAMIAPLLLRDLVQARRLQRGMTLEDLFAWQRRTALADEVSFGRWLTERGRKPDWKWHAVEGVEPPELAPPKVATRPCSSCGQPVVWGVTKAGRTMPLDPLVLRVVPASDPLGTVIVVTAAGDTVRGRRGDGPGSLEGRISHFATCPHSDDHRGARA